MSKAMSKKSPSRYPRETPEQRKWILRRDNSECQFINLDTGEKCRSKSHIEVHHISPVIYSYEFLKWTPEQVNDPENLICLCRNHHQRNIHPDFGIIAKKQYRYTKITYNLAAKRHKVLAKKGVPYWQPQWDEILRMTARIRTFRYKRAHPDDPYPE